VANRLLKRDRGERETESRCIIAVDGKESHGTEYYCISTNRMLLQ
jgi:hypothetical protein